jgi:hypothetical protein
MNRIHLIWVCAVGCMLPVEARGAEVIPIPATPVEGKIQWVYDYAEGRKLARETGKPMFVVFRCER